MVDSDNKRQGKYDWVWGLILFVILFFLAAYWLQWMKSIMTNFPNPLPFLGALAAFCVIVFFTAYSVVQLVSYSKRRGTLDTQFRKLVVVDEIYNDKVLADDDYAPIIHRLLAAATRGDQKEVNRIAAQLPPADRAALVDRLESQRTVPYAQRPPAPPRHAPAAATRQPQPTMTGADPDDESWVNDQSHHN